MLALDPLSNKTQTGTPSDSSGDDSKKTDNSVSSVSSGNPELGGVNNSVERSSGGASEKSGEALRPLETGGERSEQVHSEKRSTTLPSKPKDTTKKKKSKGSDRGGGKLLPFAVFGYRLPNKSQIPKKPQSPNSGMEALRFFIERLILIGKKEK